MVHSDWNGVNGNMSRRLCWWADLGGKYSDSLLIGGKMVHRFVKGSREVGFLLNGDYGRVRCCSAGLGYSFIVRIGFRNALRLRIKTFTRRKRKESNA